MFRRYFDVELTFNDVRYFEIQIDPHYEEKHSGSINDLLIIDLLKKVDNKTFSVVAERDGYSYFEIDVELHNKLYRLILVTPFDNIYLGVRNAYRRSR